MKGIRLPINHLVTLPMRGKGHIRFVGITAFSKDGIWYGIELEARNGKNNGSSKGVKYFKCQRPYGVFVRAEKLFAQLRGIYTSIHTFLKLCLKIR